MTNDSDKFENNIYENFEQNRYDLLKNSTVKSKNAKYYPLWEAKMFNQYDHRFATFEGVPINRRFAKRAGTNKVSNDKKADTTYEILPRYWVEESELKTEVKKLEWNKSWVFAFRNLVRTTSDKRTALSTILPMHPSGDSISLITFECDHPEQKAACFAALFNSFVFDFTLQQSLGNANFNKYIFKQLPMPAPSEIKQSELLVDGARENLYDYLVDRSLKLIWTSNNLDGFGKVIESRPGPYKWDVEERRALRAQIDAAVAHMYGITRDEFKYILNSFEILKKLEEQKFGIYLREKECLRAFSQMEII